MYAKQRRYKDITILPTINLIYYILMDIDQIQTTPIKKRFCCGAAKRLKEKCLNFHKSEEKCIDFIKGHQECILVKRRFEGRQQLPSPLQSK